MCIQSLGISSFREGASCTKVCSDITLKIVKYLVAPSDWKNAVIVPVYKKGSRLDCTNYRGISLMSVVGKVFARVLNERVKGLTVDKVPDVQGGFRAGRGCNDQIFAVKQIVEKTIEEDKKTYMAFVDSEKAYDSVSREKLWKVLHEYGVKGKLLRAMQALYVDGEGKGESWENGIGAV